MSEDSYSRHKIKDLMNVFVGTQGYVYSTFLKPYNPQRDVHNERTEDFDNLSLFVSGNRRGSHSSYTPSTPSSQQEEIPSPEDEEQHVSHKFHLILSVVTTKV